MLEAIHASKPELERWLSFAQTLSTLEECETWLRRNHARFMLREALNYELFLRSSAVFVGRAGFVRLDWTVRKFEIGFWLDSRHTGRGLMLEAVRAVTAMAFARLDARRVEIVCDERNAASRRVAEQAGFALEGILRNNALDAQDLALWVNDCIYARVR